MKNENHNFITEKQFEELTNSLELACKYYEQLPIIIDRIDNIELGKSFDQLNIEIPKFKNEHSPFSYKDKGYILHKDSFVKRFDKIIYIKYGDAYDGAIFTKDGRMFRLSNVLTMLGELCSHPWSIFDNRIYLSNADDAFIIDTMY